MCRSIQRLYNVDPPPTAEEIHAASLQFVRKVSGYRKPSHANQAAFDAAVRSISDVVSKLIDELETSAKPISRIPLPGTQSVPGTARTR